MNPSTFSRAFTNVQRFALLFAAICLAATTSCAASFDCAKASTKVEKMICADPELSKLDEDLGAAYSKALKTSSDSSALKQQQRDWLKKRNECSDANCVKQAYEQRLTVFSGAFESTAENTNTEKNTNANQRYSFQLTKGAGTDVCDAYLKRLNNTEFTSPPYCGRPENDSVKGFTKLNRVPLTPYDVRDLDPIIWYFMSNAGNMKANRWTDAAQEEVLKKGQLSESGAKWLQIYMDNGWAKIWRYSPNIDIDNDASPENVEVWHGAVFPTGIGGKRCGEYDYKFNEPVRQPQIAFIVSKSGDRLNAVKTEKVFEHPRGGYRVYDDVRQKWVTFGRFRPIGRSIGVFEYKDIYYFDTFFDGWGDFEGKRRTEGADGSNKNINIINTLAVFLHKGGKTRQVCEYLMTDHQSGQFWGHNT